MIGARVSTSVLTRVLLAAACSGCRLAAPHDLAVTPRDIIVGRATTPAGIVILTNEPALVRVDWEGRIFRSALQKPPAKLWGLASAGDELFSVAGFVDLVRVSSGGAVDKRARFPNPIANLVDTEDGMAAQLAVDAAGAALLMAADKGARLGAMPGMRRSAFGLSRAEEGVLHLLSCSAPPRVTCWLPGSDELLKVDERGVTAAARLEKVERITPARLIAQPARRAIHDALALPGDTFVVLLGRPGSSKPVITIFDGAGRLKREVATVRPLRVLLDQSERGVRAIDVDGRVIEVPL